MWYNHFIIVGDNMKKIEEKLNSSKKLNIIGCEIVSMDDLLSSAKMYNNSNTNFSKFSVIELCLTLNS